jgi:hypothetical protein
MSYSIFLSNKAYNSFTISIILRVCCIVLFVLVTGCTARVKQITAYSEKANYKTTYYKELEVHVKFKGRPGDRNFLMNRTFKGLKMVAIEINMKNKSDYRLVINREDIVLISTDNNRYYPLSREDAARRASGPAGIYQVFSLGKIHYGYLVYGLDEKVVLDPEEQKSGYLFYKVYKEDNESARNGKIKILFSRMDSIDNRQYVLPLAGSGDKQGK